MVVHIQLVKILCCYMGQSNATWVRVLHVIDLSQNCFRSQKVRQFSKSAQANEKNFNIQSRH